MGGESEAAWRAVLDDLVARGLKTPQFLIIDGAAGLERALATLWPAVPVQRCTVHWRRSALSHVPAKQRPAVTAMIKTIFAQESATDAHAQWTRTVEQRCRRSARARAQARRTDGRGA